MRTWCSDKANAHLGNQIIVIRGVSAAVHAAIYALARQVLLEGPTHGALRTFRNCNLAMSRLVLCCGRRLNVECARACLVALGLHEV